MRENGILQILENSRYTVALTGAGMLIESGYPLLRDGEESYEIENRYGYSFEEIFSSGFYSARKELFFRLPARRGLVNITRDVQAAIDESGIREGLCLVNAMHITASVFVNDDESGLHADFEEWLEGLAPEKPYSRYRHNGYEDNADAHLKRTIMGREVVAAVTEGKLDFGPWEQIFYFEFDGKRQKRALIKIIGE